MDRNGIWNGKDQTIHIDNPLDSNNTNICDFITLGTLFDVKLRTNNEMYADIGGGYNLQKEAVIKTWDEYKTFYDTYCDKNASMFITASNKTAEALVHSQANIFSKSNNFDADNKYRGEFTIIKEINKSGLLFIEDVQDAKYDASSLWWFDVSNQNWDHGSQNIAFDFEYIVTSPDYNMNTGAGILKNIGASERFYYLQAARAANFKTFEIGGVAKQIPGELPEHQWITAQPTVTTWKKLHQFFVSKGDQVRGRIKVNISFESPKVALGRYSWRGNKLNDDTIFNQTYNDKTASWLGPWFQFDNAVVY